jgi:hypothetical protein
MSAESNLMQHLKTVESSNYPQQAVEEFCKGVEESAKLMRELSPSMTRDGLLVSLAGIAVGVQQAAQGVFVACGAEPGDFITYAIHAMKEMEKMK